MSMPEHIYSHSSSQHEPSSARPEIIRMVRGDFKKTFYHAQGSVSGHLPLLALVSNEYHQMTPDDQAELPSAVAKVKDQLDTFTLPSYHAPVEEPQIRKEFRDRFEFFSQCITNPNYIPRAARKDGTEGDALPTDPAELLGLVVTYMVQGDIRYAAPLESKARSSSQDPKRSLFKSFVLDSQPTGSPRLDSIFVKARNHSLANHPDPFVQRLHFFWRMTHRGQDFYPPDFKIT